MPTKFFFVALGGAPAPPAPPGYTPMSQRAATVCSALESINADLKGVTYDSPQAVPIGTVACSIMCLVLAAVIILDSGKLYDDLKMMKSNVRRLMGRPSPKVEPSP